jgi:hypothetical protein
VEEPGQVGRNERRVVAGGVVGERLGDEDPGVVDQQVERAEGRARGVECARGG